MKAPFETLFALSHRKMSIFFNEILHVLFLFPLIKYVSKEKGKTAPTQRFWISDLTSCLSDLKFCFSLSVSVSVPPALALQIKMYQKKYQNRDFLGRSIIFDRPRFGA